MMTKVFRSIDEVMLYYFPKKYEAERRAKLTKEERIQEDAERMAKQLLRDLREAIVKNRK